MWRKHDQHRDRLRYGISILRFLRMSGGSAEQALVIERIFDASRELVFEAWTDPERVVHWWGPRGFTTTVHEMDVRPGGVWRFVMHGPDGTNYDNRVVFLEVVQPERLVYDHGDDKGSLSFRVTVTFEADGDKTRLTVQMVFASAEERDRLVEEGGAKEGLNQTLDRLAEYLRKQLRETQSP